MLAVNGVDDWRDENAIPDVEFMADLSGVAIIGNIYVLGAIGVLLRASIEEFGA